MAQFNRVRQSWFEVYNKLISSDVILCCCTIYTYIHKWWGGMLLALLDPIQKLYFWLLWSVSSLFFICLDKCLGFNKVLFRFGPRPRPLPRLHCIYMLVNFMTRAKCRFFSLFDRKNCRIFSFLSVFFFFCRFDEMYWNWLNKERFGRSF